MKKIVLICIMLTFAVITAFAGGKKEDGKFNVGICQLVQHPALDSATQGFKDALLEELGADKVKFDERNASGEVNNCSTIVNGFVSSNVDLIMANATAALQASASATSTIPVLGTSITQYAVALELDSWSGTVGGNISGTSDLAPLDQQAQVLKEWFPKAKNVGILYCSAEANSIYQVEEIEKYLEDIGFKTERFSFTDTNDVASVTQRACDRSDVLFIPTDNTAASNAEAIANVALASKTPIIAGEEGLCKECGIATLSINYYDLGYTTGLMAAKILRGEADISTMPIGYAPATKKYNPSMCEKYGIAPLAGYVAIE